MKNTIKSLFVASSLFALPFIGYANVVSATLTPSQTAILLTQPATVSSIVLTATTATNTVVNIIDASSTNFNYVLTGYTNIVSFGTNYIFSYTNYFGVPTLLTNFVLLDTTNAVSTATNNYPLVALGAPLSSSINVVNPNMAFFRGIWATNASTGNATITITYQNR